MPGWWGWGGRDPKKRNHCSLRATSTLTPASGRAAELRPRLSPSQEGGSFREALQALPHALGISKIPRPPGSRRCLELSSILPAAPTTRPPALLPRGRHGFGTGSVAWLPQRQWEGCWRCSLGLPASGLASACRCPGMVALPTPEPQARACLPGACIYHQEGVE